MYVLRTGYRLMREGGSRTSRGEHTSQSSARARVTESQMWLLLLCARLTAALEAGAAVPWGLPVSSLRGPVHPCDRRRYRYSVCVDRTGCTPNPAFSCPIIQHPFSYYGRSPPRQEPQPAASCLYVVEGLWKADGGRTVIRTNRGSWGLPRPNHVQERSYIITRVKRDRHRRCVESEFATGRGCHHLTSNLSVIRPSIYRLLNLESPAFPRTSSF